MRASTRWRVSGPTSAHARTTLETVITETSRSRAISFRRTGDFAGLGIIRRGARRRRNWQCLQPEGEYNKLRAQGWPASPRVRRRPALKAWRKPADIIQWLLNPPGRLSWATIRTIGSPKPDSRNSGLADGEARHHRTQGRRIWAPITPKPISQP